MKSTEVHRDPQDLEPDQVAADSQESVSAWTEIEPGRFMPRRIRGSYRGAKLG
jgi:hypothetical protein